MRFKPVVEGTFPFFYDHGRDMLDVRKIVEDKNFTFIGPTTGLKGLYHGPLHYYLLSIGYLLSGGHPASGVVMIVLMQLGGGGLCFYLGHKLFGLRFGLALSTLYLLALNSINVSVMFWNPYWIPSFMVLFYAAVLITLQRGGKWWLLVGFLAGLVAQFEIAFGIFLVPFIVCVGLLFERGFYKNIYFWLAFVCFVLPFTPLIAFDIKNGFLMFKSIISVLNGTYVGLGDYIPWEMRTQYRMTELLRMTIQSLSVFSWVNWLLFGLALAGIGSALWRKEWSALRYCLLFVLLPIIVFTGFMIYSKPAWTYYWVGLQVSYYFFVAYCLYLLSRFARWSAVAVGAACGLFAVCSIQIVRQDTTFLTHEPGIYRNQLLVVDSIYADSQKSEFGEWVYTPPIYDYTYEYLFYWRGRQRHGFVPSHRTDIPYYLIIEPNKERPWESTGWRKGISGDRMSEWSKKMTGDIIVEKYAAH
jgi:4-amino-4-deoxy-L-arabinose transferase-like glycosyltransferase